MRCLDTHTSVACSAMKATRHWFQETACVGGGVLAMIMAASVGCEAPAPTTSIGHTQVDRLMRVYPDLQSGRFVTIADFENPRHVDIVQMKRASAGASYALDSNRGRSETGGACLAFTVAMPSDTLTISNVAAKEWYMRRDWRAYDLLMLSIHSPLPSLTVGLSITGGPRSERFSTTTTVKLEAGWNLARIDLAGVGERVPLRDVREIGLTVAGAPGPVTLLLDDIILTANRKTLLGDPDDPAGGLYALRVGRQWKIGARRPGRFELTFANGQIVGWYNLEADPDRRRNLVWGTALGPALVTPDGLGVDRAVSVKSQIVELSEVRAVISSEWRPADRPTSAFETRRPPPIGKVVYTIYPTGQIFVRLTSPSGAAGPSTSQLGLAVSVAASSEGGLETMMTEREKGKPSPHLPTYAAARMPSNDSLLLYVVRDAEGTMRVKRITSGSGSAADRTSFVVFPPEGAAPKTSWECHLLVGSSRQVDGSQVFARALGYAAPVLPHIELGFFEAVEGGETGQFGFDGGSGCFLIAPDRGRVRIILDGSLQPYFSPAFRISNPQRRDARVYVDHLIFDHAALDSQGNVVFQLPFTVDRRVMVEVLFPQSP